MRQRHLTPSFTSIGRLFILLLFALVGLFVLAGYLIGRQVTLTYWYTETPAETPVILQRIGQFQQQYPNIKINAVYKPYPQAQTAVVLQKFLSSSLLRVH